MPEALHLPPAAEEELKRAPLELVVCQVRHDRTLATSEAARILRVQTDLAELFGGPLKVEDQTQHEIGIAINAGVVAQVPGTPELQRGWRLTSSDSRWVIALMPDFFAIESTGYTSWTDFRARLEALTRSVQEHLQPAIQLRVGLRYVDKLNDPSAHSPGDWDGLVDPAILGPIQHPGFGPALVGVQQVMELAGTEGTKAVVRHGTQFDSSSETWPYMLDTDCFDDSSSPFDGLGVLETVDGLHEMSLRLFQTMITQRLYDYLSE